jgi:glycosyltransferase involved in cell wall biosynthesis
MKISVIIPAFNEEKHIRRTLSALAMQDVNKESFEVIVVDNGSSDSTLSIIEQFSSLLPVRVLSLPNGNISKVRNRGVETATGEILAFLDADCVPKARWLCEALTVRHERGIWGAHYSVPADATWVGSLWGKYQATERSGAVSFLPAGDMFILREDFLNIGSFNEDLDTSEDVELCQRALKKNLHVSAFPSLAVEHHGTPRTLAQFYRQNRWHGRHVLRKFIANLPSLGNLPIVALSLYTFLMFWISILFPAFAIGVHHWRLALIPPTLLLLPFVAISVIKTLRSVRVYEAPALAILYTTYFFSRAAALSFRSDRNHR